MGSQDWERARGSNSVDCNNFILLVRAPVERIARLIAEDSEVWQEDVAGQEVVIRRTSMFVFRLKGQSWSVLLQSLDGTMAYGRPGRPWERWLSLRLDAPVIEYSVSDTCGSVEYALLEAGQVVEEFQAEGGGPFTPEDIRFASVRRRISFPPTLNASRFVEQFLAEHDAFDPGIGFGYFYDVWSIGFDSRVVLKTDQPLPLIVSKDGLDSAPPFERVDHLVLRVGDDEEAACPGREVHPEAS